MSHASPRVNWSPYAAIEMTVAHHPDYVLGFPMHMAITVNLNKSVISVGGLPHLSLYTPPLLTAKMTHVPTSEEHVYGVRPSRFPAGEPYAGYTLTQGKSRRMMVDLTDLDLSGLKEGVTQIEISYLESTAPPFEVVLHAPTAAQKAELAQLRGNAADTARWGTWSMMPGKPAGMGGKSDPARFNRVLHHLFTAPGGPSAIHVGVLDLLDGLYAPEAQLLRAEVAWARNDKLTYAREAAKVKAKFPELDHALEEIEQGGTLIGTAHEQHHVLFDL